jgi:hypothetical protein
MGTPRGVENFNLAAPSTVLLATAEQAAARYTALHEYPLAGSVRHDTQQPHHLTQTSAPLKLNPHENNPSP